MPFKKLTPSCNDSDHDLLAKIDHLLSVAAGRFGNDHLLTGGTATGEWTILHALADSTVTIVRNGVSETLNITAGDRIYGEITSIVVNSGDVELYKSCY